MEHRTTRQKLRQIRAAQHFFWCTFLRRNPNDIDCIIYMKRDLYCGVRAAYCERAGQGITTLAARFNDVTYMHASEHKRDTEIFGSESPNANCHERSEGQKNFCSEAYKIS